VLIEKSMMILIQPPIMPALALTTIDCLNAYIDRLYTTGGFVSKPSIFPERERVVK